MAAPLWHPSTTRAALSRAALSRAALSRAALSRAAPRTSGVPVSPAPLAPPSHPWQHYHSLHLVFLLLLFSSSSPLSPINLGAVCRADFTGEEDDDDQGDSHNRDQKHSVHLQMKTRKTLYTLASFLFPSITCMLLIALPSSSSPSF